jgi:hypothetical protein
MSIEPIAGEPTRWVVMSESRDGWAFIVDSDYEGGWACGCEQFMVRGLECKHIRAVKRVAARFWHERGLTFPLIADPGADEIKSRDG